MSHDEIYSGPLVQSFIIERFFFNFFNWVIIALVVLVSAVCSGSIIYY